MRCFVVLVAAILSGIGAIGLDASPGNASDDSLASLLEAARNHSPIQIPRSMPGDKGKDYLIAAERDGDVIRALHKREGVFDIGFTLTESNCSTMKMRELGDKDGSPEGMSTSDPTKWFDLVSGSSKSDLWRFLCQTPPEGWGL